MSVDINFHTHGELYCTFFMPENNMCIGLGVSGRFKDKVDYYGIEPAKAWALFDLFRTGATDFLYDAKLGETKEETIARARAETLGDAPQPKVETVEEEWIF